MIPNMFPEPLLHLRAAIRRGCHPDDRDIRWLAQNPAYLEALEPEVKTAAEHWLEAKELLLLPTTTSGSDRKHL